MMRLGLSVVLLCVAGCNTADHAFRGAPATRITVEGSTFDIRVAGGQAEALRINHQYAPRFGPIRARAAFAMAQVSGCEVAVVSGDQARAVGLLDCGEGAELPRHRTLDLECVPVRDSQVVSLGEARVELDCYPA